MTVIKDFESESFKLVRYMDCEFYEIMARIADTQSVGTQYEDQLLKKKMEQIIDQLVKIKDKKQKVILYQPPRQIIDYKKGHNLINEQL